MNKTFALFISISYSLCSYLLPSRYSKVWTQALKNLCCLQYNNCKKSGSLSSQSLEAQALCLYSSQFIFFSCSIAINYNVKQKSPTLKAELFCFRAIIRNDSPKTLKFHSQTLRLSPTLHCQHKKLAPLMRCSHCISVIATRIWIVYVFTKLECRGYSLSTVAIQLLHCIKVITFFHTKKTDTP